MTAQIMFFTDKSVEDLVVFTGGSDSLNYTFKEMGFNCPGINENVLPGLIQYGVGHSLRIGPVFDLAKEYLSKKGKTFIVIMICLGYQTPSHTLMPEVVLDLKDHEPRVWPQSLIDHLPEERTWKEYDFAKEFSGYSPSKKNPFLEWFTKYRLIDSGIK